MKKRILIVDDEREACQTLVDILSDNYETHVAYDGKEAIDRIADVRPDLVIMDYDMPVLDGIATLEVLMCNDEYKDITFILLSAYLHGKRVQDWLKLQKNPHIFQKPCDIEELTAAIKNALVD